MNATFTKKEKNILETLMSYVGTTCFEILYNRLETVLNDVYVGHLAILEEDFNITEKQIISIQNKL